MFGSSQHMFGIGRRAPTVANQKKIDEIAKSHGYDFIATTLPGTGYQHWFAGPNRGNPFDRQAELAIWADLKAAGLADDGGIIPRGEQRRGRR